MVEFDGREKSEQFEIFKQSGLPIACVLDSGNKSLHAWIRVDAVDRQQYKERQEKVYSYLGDYIDDPGNKNPSRFSRFAGSATR
jgi:regulatory protein RepA